MVLDSSVVAVVDVGGILGIALSLSSSTIRLLLDLEEKSVKLVALVLDGLLDSLLQSRAHSLESNGLGDGKEQLVPGLLDLEVEVLHVNVNLLDLEEVLAILLVRGGKLHLERETISGKDDIGNTSVGDGGKALLALDVEADISQIHLDTSNLDLDGVGVLVGNLLAAPAEVVLVSQLKDVGSKIVTLKNKVLDDGVELVIGVLDTRDRDVGNVLKDSGKDDISQIADQMRLEDRLAILIVAEISEQLLERVGKGLVLSVLVELIDQELDLVDNTVGVAAVLVTEEESTLIVELVPLTGGSIIKDVSLLEEAAADVRVHGLEPVLELTVLIGVAVDLVDSIPEVSSRGAVGVAFDDGAQVILGLLETTTGVLGGANRILANLLTVLAVGLGEAENGLNSLGVVLVLLALKNHLLEAPDGLIPTLLRHLLVKVVLCLLTVLLLPLNNVVLGLLIEVVIELLLGNILGSIATSQGVSIPGTGILRNVLLEVALLGGGTRLLVARGGGVGTGGGNVLGVLSRVSAVETLALLLQVVLGEIGGIMPGVILSRLINLRKVLIRGANTGSSVAGGITSHVADEESGVLEELSELAVGDDQLPKGSETLEGLIAISLRSVLANGCVGSVDTLGIEVGGLPDEVLDQVALIPGQEEVLGLIDDFTSILDESLALWRELLRVASEGARSQEAAEGDVDLVVLLRDEWLAMHR